MRQIPATPELLEVAGRLVWFADAPRALAQPYLFLAHVMTFGTVEDIVTVRDALGMEAFREALDHAPPGIFDARSWAYWHLMCDRWPGPPLPARFL